MQMKRLIAPLLDRIEKWRGSRGVILLRQGTIRPAISSYAVIAGVRSGCRVLPALQSASQDARRLAELLMSEYGFQILCRDGLLVEEQANASALRQAVEEGLRQAGADSRWLFYFSGQGVAFGGKPYLVPYHCSQPAKEGCIEVQWLIDRCLQSACRETLIILDVDFADQWNPPAFTDWLDLDKSKNARVRQFIAAGAGAFQSGEGNRRRSRFSSDLLQALQGWAGIHRGEDSSVPLSRLLGWLKSPVIDPASESQLSDALGGNLAGTEQGQFTFVPVAGYDRRIPSEWVREIRSDKAQRRRDGLAWLEREARRWGERQEGQRGRQLPDPSPKLPLAVRLASNGLPSRPLEDVLTGRHSACWHEDEDLVREQAARTLGALLPFEATAPSALEPLLHLAISHKSVAVRSQALGNLKHVRGKARNEAARRLKSLEKQCRGRTARKLRLALASIPESRRDDSRRRRLLDRGLRLQLLGGRVGLWVWRDPRRKALAFSLAGLPVLMSAILLGSVHLSSAAQPNPRDHQVVLRYGLPGFGFVPFSGNVAVETDFRLDQLESPQLVEQEELRDSWLNPRIGMLNWGRKLFSCLPPELAALERWWTGDEAKALQTLMPSGATPPPSALRSLVYLAIHSDEALDQALERLPGSLQSSPNPRLEIEALERLADARWEDVQGTLGGLRQQLQAGSDSDEIALCEAVAALGRPDRATLGTALDHTFALLRGATDEQHRQRLIRLLQRILRDQPNLAPPSFSALMSALQRLPWADRPALLGLLEATPPDSPQAAGQAHSQLESLFLPSDQASQKAALLRLASRWMAAHPSLAGSYRRLLLLGLGEADPAVVKAAADAVAALAPNERKSLGRKAVARLSDLLKSKDIAEPSQIIEKLERLTDSSTAALSQSALLQASASRNSVLRAPALDALGRLALRKIIAPSSIRSTLRIALEDDDEWVRQAATQSLLLLTGKIDEAALKDSQIAANLGFLKRFGWGGSTEFADRFSLATPEAAALAARVVMEELHRQRVSFFEQRAFLHRLVQVRPEIFPAYLEIVAELYTRDFRETRQQRVWEYLQEARRLPLKVRQEALDRMIQRLSSAASAERVAAAEVIGFLIVECDDLIEPAFPYIAQLLRGPLEEAGVSAAETLEPLASRPGWSAPSLQLLLEGLNSQRPAIRQACAKSLSWIAPPPGSSTMAAPLVRGLNKALRDPIPFVRRRAAIALALWGRKVPSPLASQSAQALLDCLEAEREAAVRIEMAAALGVIAEDPRVVRHAIEVGEEYRDASPSELQEARIDLLRKVGEVHPSLRIEAIRRLGEAPFQDLSLPAQRRIHALRRLGALDAESALAAVEALSARQEHSSASIRQFVLHNALIPIIRGQPAAQRAALLASFDSVQQEKALRSPASREDQLWNDWVDLAVTAALQDAEPVWASLVRPDDRKERNAARRALLRLAVRHPDKAPQIAERAARLVHSRCPEARRSAAQLRDLLAMLQRLRARLSDAGFRLRWQRVLDWVPKIPGMEELQSLLKAAEAQ